MGLHKSVLMVDLQSFIKNISKIKPSKHRSESLQILVDYIQHKIDRKLPVNLHFICTHNSRRSQLAQIWAQTMACYFGLEIRCFSGGVEATAFNERAVKTLVRAGFQVQKNEHPDNPIYQIFYVKGKSPLLAFSKLVDDPINPVFDFAAIMTCAHADENCPVVLGAEMRIPIRYDDPKSFDNTPEESLKYDERSTQIASEMYWVFSRIK
ncbi:MAG: protein-tyrosine-phosphatase [Flavobacteriaceae bacterium]|nr:protein-tyrosine-phosphatase [Flavobacteriaceae bacterium]MDZ4147395.1 protein-tyrosine-phosphatase [Flavobacteriaceae bacterium]